MAHEGKLRGERPSLLFQPKVRTLTYPVNGSVIESLLDTPRVVGHHVAVGHDEVEQDATLGAYLMHSGEAEGNRPEIRKGNLRQFE